MDPTLALIDQVIADRAHEDPREIDAPITDEEKAAALIKFVDALERGEKAARQAYANSELTDNVRALIEAMRPAARERRAKWHRELEEFKRGEEAKWRARAPVVARGDEATSEPDDPNLDAKERAHRQAKRVNRWWEPIVPQTLSTAEEAIQRAEDEKNDKATAERKRKMNRAADWHARQVAEERQRQEVLKRGHPTFDWMR
jgi:hypothetical protein